MRGVGLKFSLSSLSPSNEAEASGPMKPVEKMSSRSRRFRAFGVLRAFKKKQILAILVSAFFSFCLGLGICLVHTIVIHLGNASKHAPIEARLHKHRNFLDRLEDLKTFTDHDASRYEALVHPAMISSDDITRVGIISVLAENSNESGIVRTLHILNEVLKHKSVQEVMIFDIPVNDPDHQEQGSYRRNIHRFDADCLRDECNRLQGGLDATYAHRNKENSTEVCECRTHKFDIEEIIYNSNNVEFYEKLDLAIINVDEVDDQYRIFKKDNGQFPLIQALFNVLSDNGMIVSTSRGNDQTLVNSMDRVGFRSIHVYQDSSSRKNQSVQNYVIAFKAFESRSKWYQNAAEIDLLMRRRIIANKSTGMNLFDARTMISYQTPHRAIQNNFCRLKPTECVGHMGFEPNTKTLPSTVLNVAKSSVGEHAGRGLFASNTIPKGFIIGLDEQVGSFSFNPSSSDILDVLCEKDYLSGTDYESLVTFVYGYGYGFTHVRGHTEYVIDSGRMLFANHGCNGTDNYGPHYPHYTENTIDLDAVPPLFDEIGSFNPVVERHLRQFMTSDGGSSRDIAAGEELLTNYLLFSGSVLADWQEDVLSLRGQCEGLSLGNITAYEAH